MPRKNTFEQALEELEAIVREMEQGNLPLEQAVKKYEQGVKQSKYCLDLLEKTEQKIKRLSVDDNLNLVDNDPENSRQWDLS